MASTDGGDSADELKRIVEYKSVLKKHLLFRKREICPAVLPRDVSLLLFKQCVDLSPVREIEVVIPQYDIYDILKSINFRVGTFFHDAKLESGIDFLHQDVFINTIIRTAVNKLRYISEHAVSAASHRSVNPSCRDIFNVLYSSFYIIDVYRLFIGYNEASNNLFLRGVASCAPSGPYTVSGCGSLVTIDNPAFCHTFIGPKNEHGVYSDYVSRCSWPDLINCKPFNVTAGLSYPYTHHHNGRTDTEHHRLCYVQGKTRCKGVWYDFPSMFYDLYAYLAGYHTDFHKIMIYPTSTIISMYNHRICVPHIHLMIRAIVGSIRPTYTVASLIAIALSSAVVHPRTYIINNKYSTDYIGIMTHDLSDLVDDLSESDEHFS